jgi:3-dehydroquinate dehydratase
MVIYKIINPANYTHTIVAINLYLAIQTAKKLDNYKYSEREYIYLKK